MTLVLYALLLSMGLNLLVFALAYKQQTDHYTDITYSASFISIVILAMIYSGNRSMTSLILFIMICLWAIRLGSYLFIRIKRIGVDHRFDEMRPYWKRYIGFWLLQGGSVWLLSLPFLLAFSWMPTEHSLETLQYFGILIWLIGFLLESIADYQKYQFRSKASNDGQFMNEGLFSVIRYPNYLGEMMIWIGIFIFCSPYLSGLGWLSIVSPIWIVVLLLFISGIPYLEKQTVNRYGHLDTFKSYVKNTAKLIPGIF